MRYDFDRVIDRRGTDCIKWQFHHSEGAVVEWEDGRGCFEEEGVLPLWVADMDFQSPQPVIDAIVNRARHGMYGYTGRTRAYDESVMLWMRKRHGWDIQPEWITTTPGVVNALFQAVQAFTGPGERIIIQPPVYHPFTHAIEKTGRVPARSPLVLRDGRYEMDFAGLEALARQPDVRMAILCHPHNPIGRVWTEAELRRFGEICNAHGVLVVSDEIHSDLIFRGHRFLPYALLSEEFAQNALICTAPSKTFNLPGLKTANIIIPNAEIRKRFAAQLEFNGLYGLSTFGSTALQAAYQHGEGWLAQVMAYIEDNYDYFVRTLEEQLPQVRVIPTEGTYLAWVDFRALGTPGSELHARLLDEAKVYLDDGSIFGAEGDGFLRFNIACPRSILAEALERIVKVLMYNF